MKSEYKSEPEIKDEQGVKNESELKIKIKNFSDQDLILNLKNLIQQERSLLTEILLHLREVEERRIFLTLGFSSLYEYVTQELGYNEAQAYRRIQAMRVLREVPEIEEKIDQGKLTLTQITQAQEYFRSEKKKGVPLSQEEKQEVLNEIETKSTRETEKYFIKLSPELAAKDKTRLIDEERVEIKFVANQKLLEKLNRFKVLDAHAQTNPDYADLFERLVDLALKQKDPELKRKNNSKKNVKATLEKRLENRLENSTKENTKKSANVNEETHDLFSENNRKEPENKTHDLESKNSSLNKSSFQNKNSSPKLSAQTNPRSTPAQVKREVMARDQGACTYKSSITGKICGSKYQVELDHITPVALGGQSTVDNLRVLCRNHNLHEARRVFGADKMEEYCKNSVKKTSVQGTVRLNGCDHFNAF